MSLSSRKNDAYFLPILCAVAAILIALTWHRWGDVVVDCGKDLIAAARVAGGEVLYRDIQYNYGPLSPYLRAFLFTVLGANIGAAVIAGVASLISAVVLCYLLARRFLPGACSFFFAFSFLLICALPQYDGAGGYNFMIPYAAPAVDGFNLSMLSLLFLSRYIESGSGPHLAAGSILTTLLFLTKMEFAAASFAAWIFAVVLSGRGIMPVVSFSALSILPATAVYSLFALAAGIENLLFKNVFPVHIATTLNFLFPKLLMGTADPSLSFEAAVKSLAIFSAAAATGFLTASSRPFLLVPAAAVFAAIF
ncbi:MAG: hypothetical protein FJ088_05545, partial [Deltaproteobacteria bacterium]|nr:hypothetical protein [Deltaproteobacteria bacterium]